MIEFQISDEDMEDRAMGRLVHKASGRTYHKLYKVFLGDIN